MTHTQVAETLAERRALLGVLIREHFAGQNDWVAAAIHKFSGKPVSRRSVQAWLSHPERPSSRNCPDWAYQALQQAISDPKHWKPGPKHNTLDPPSRDPFARFDEFADKYLVDCAAGQIEQEARWLKEWESANIAALPKKLFELQRSLEAKIDVLDSLIEVWFDALKDSNDHSSLRDSVARHRTAQSVMRSELRKTRNAIERRTEEFSNDEGIPIPDRSPGL